MMALLVVAGVWAVCCGVLLHLHYEVRRTRYPAPDKCEPYYARQITALTVRGCIHVEVAPGHEADAADQVLRADLLLSKAGR